MGMTTFSSNPGVGEYGIPAVCIQNIGEGRTQEKSEKEKSRTDATQSHGLAGQISVNSNSHSSTNREAGNCIIILTSGAETTTDTFRLVDVAVKAQQIIDECPWKSKKHLGGLALIGNRKHFFVAVNGPDDTVAMRMLRGNGGGVSSAGKNVRLGMGMAEGLKGFAEMADGLG
ncbi:hypothetical protein ACLMJK_005574 [Lecanora helva]